MPVLRLATRTSPLALWQARHVARLLRRTHPSLRVTLVPVVSSGDVDRTTPLYGLGTQGIFVKEVQDRVLAGEADAGVHSCKDLPTEPAAGLVIAAVLRRADPRDALVGTASVAALPRGALIGTSSLRRQAQLAALRPDLRFTNIRGNVDTRLRKVRERVDGVEATVMAMAGLARLGLIRIAGAVALDPIVECTPAPAQGAVAVDCRGDDRRTRFLLAAIAHRATTVAVGIEREVLAGLRGGCSLPLGCLAWREADGWHLRVRLGLAGSGLHELALTGAAGGLARRALAALPHC
jgi:hydroxymethylbilane synthase